MRTLYPLNYNSYYNRIVKREDSLEDYIKYMIDPAPKEGINFNPNDGIDTVINFRWSSLYKDFPNYMVVVDENNNMTLWFVIEAQRQSKDNYNVQLHRDVVAEFYDEIAQAPMFIEKGIIPRDNKLIFNSENMIYNQIKTNETRLYDKTNTPWIVGYVTDDSSLYQSTAVRDPDDDNIERTTLSPQTLPQTTRYDGIVTSSDIPTVQNLSLLEDYLDDHPDGKVYKDITATYLDIYFKDSSLLGKKYKIRYTLSNDIFGDITYYNNQVLSSSEWEQQVEIPKMAYIKSTTDFNDKADVIPSYAEQRNGLNIYSLNTLYQGYDLFNIEQFFQYNNKTIQDNNGNIYFLRINELTTNSIQRNITSDDFGGELESVTQLRPNVTRLIIQDNTSLYGKCYGYASYYEVRLIPSTQSQIHTSINYSTINKLNDAPWHMFAIPYIAENVKFTDGTNTIDMNSGSCLSIVTNIMRQESGNGRLKDLQLLPYCPFREMFEYYDEDTKAFDLSSFSRGADYSLLSDLDDPTFADSSGIILWAKSSNFTFTIPFTIEIPEDNIDFKIMNETKFLRLCAPDGSAVYQFKATENYGIDYIDVDCTYRPINPYIHANPNFKQNSMYGGDYNDTRGLICSGDFSMPTILDSWAQYQNQNKNYAGIFNRDIQNLNISQNYERTMQGWNIAAGTIGAIGSGVSAGAMIGGPAGLATGVAMGVAGGAASLGAGLTDYKLSEGLRDEAKNYKVDMYNYQLGNIQAVAQTVAKTGSQSFNNKLVLFIEEYSATDNEETALRNKLKYNSMTLNIIGTISQYTYLHNNIDEKQYIKGKIIRLESISDDFHLLNAIGAEMDKGVFI